MNAPVMLFFFSLYPHRPAVMFSLGGLTIKATQLLLEIALVYLIVRGRQVAQRRADA